MPFVPIDSTVVNGPACVVTKRTLPLAFAIPLPPTRTGGSGPPSASAIGANTRTASETSTARASIDSSLRAFPLLRRRVESGSRGSGSAAPAGEGREAGAAAAGFELRRDRRDGGDPLG